MIIKKLTFEKFANHKLQGAAKEIKGGVWTSTSTGGAHKGQRDAFYTNAQGSPYVVYENGDSYWLGPGRVREL